MVDTILKKNNPFIGTGSKLLRARKPPEQFNYGYLYTFPVCVDSRKISSEDRFIIPRYTEWSSTNSDFLDLANSLGGPSVAGGALCDTDMTYWSSNAYATNTSKFNGRGSSMRYVSDTEFQTGFMGYGTLPLGDFKMWTDAFGGRGMCADNAVVASYLNNSNSISVPNSGGAGTSDVRNGLSIRLVSLTTNLTEGASGVYIGNDGTIYRTICIGGKEWLAENLKETKFRDGTTIAEVQSYTDWATHNSIMNVTSGSSLFNSYTSAENLYSQSFYTSGNRLLKVTIKGNGVGSPNICIRLFIYSESSGLPSTLLYQSQGRQPAWAGTREYKFLINCELSAGNYCIVIGTDNSDFSPTHNASNYMQYYADSSNPYSSGTMGQKLGAGSWTAVTGFDLTMSIEEVYPRLCAFANNHNYV